MFKFAGKKLSDCIEKCNDYLEYLYIALAGIVIVAMFALKQTHIDYVFYGLIIGLLAIISRKLYFVCRALEDMTDQLYINDRTIKSSIKEQKVAVDEIVGEQKKFFDSIFKPKKSNN